MTLQVTVCAANPSTEEKWVSELRSATGGDAQVAIRARGRGGELGQVVFVDAAIPGLPDALAAIDRRGRALFLILEEDARAHFDSAQAALREGKVDDILIHPFRALEVHSKLRHYQQILMWDEVTRLNESFSELIERLHDDLRLAERMQKAKVPLRFPEVRGFKVASRYLAGMKSGGDHFDLADAKDGSQFSVLLSDSSSYGLSSSILSALMRIAVKLSSDELRSSSETVRRIYEELALTLKEKDRLSMFYGVISRKDLTLRYLNLGSSCAFHSPAGRPFQDLPSQGAQLSSASGFPTVSDGTLRLDPLDRIVLLSDGFIDAAGGRESARTLLDRFREKEPLDCLNELVFQVKSRFTEPDDMPEQDCTGIVLDVDSRVLRLHSGG